MATDLHDIALWFRDKGLVGESELALVQTVIAISNKPLGFGIEAPAGSGKTVALDLLIGADENDDNCLIKPEYVYYKDAGSSTSFFYDAEKINRARIIVFKELQKDHTFDTVEAIKSMTEGKSAGRRVTNVTSQEVERQEIKPKTVLWSLAQENNAKPDAELRRRCIVMSTDISKEQTKRVLVEKAKGHWDRDSSRVLTDEKADSIRKDVNTLFLINRDVVIPYAEEFAEIIGDFAPDQKVRSMLEHFWNVLEGVAKVNSLTDPVYTRDRKIIASIQDLMQTLAIYKQSFIRDVYSIPPLGDFVLKGFEDAGKVEKTEGPKNMTLDQFQTDKKVYQWVDVNHLRKALREVRNVNLPKNMISQICRQLVDAGYLEDTKEGSTIKYTVQDSLEEFTNPSFDYLLEQSAKKVKEKYPEIYDKWLENQYKPYRHPITGEVMKANGVES